MPVTVLIPTALRSHIKNQSSVSVEGRSVQEVLQHLVTQYPELKSHIMAENGNIRTFINVFVNEDDIRQKGDLKAPVKNGDEISIVPSIAGGNMKSDFGMIFKNTRS